MGVDAGDFDNDGDEDIVIGELLGQGGNLYRERWNRRVHEQSARTGIRAPYTGGTPVRRRLGRFRQRRLAGHRRGERRGSIRSAGALRTLRAAAAQAAVPQSRNGRFEDVTGRAGAAFARRGVVAASRSAISTTTATWTSLSATDNGASAPADQRGRQSAITGSACVWLATAGRDMLGRAGRSRAQRRRRPLAAGTRRRQLRVRKRSASPRRAWCLSGLAGARACAMARRTYGGVGGRGH